MMSIVTGHLSLVTDFPGYGERGTVNEISLFCFFKLFFDLLAYPVPRTPSPEK